MVEFDSKLSTVNNKTTPLSAAIIEIRQYATEPNIGRKDNPLAWWKSREMIYPRLAKLAKKNLSVCNISAKWACIIKDWTDFIGMEKSTEAIKCAKVDFFECESRHV